MTDDKCPALHALRSAALTTNEGRSSRHGFYMLGGTGLHAGNNDHDVAKRSGDHLLMSPFRLYIYYIVVFGTLALLERSACSSRRDSPT